LKFQENPTLIQPISNKKKSKPPESNPRPSLNEQKKRWTCISLDLDCGLDFGTNEQGLREIILLEEEDLN